MDIAVFERFRDIIYQNSGINLTKEKLPLLSNRLQRRLKALGVSDEKKYLQIVESDANGRELWELIEAISTNTTHFYREAKHFQVLDTLLREFAEEGRQSLKIWCAAASSGEEPYTLAFQVAESLDLSRIKVKILATDINTKVLTHATAGVYRSEQLNSVPPLVKQKYLLPVDDTKSTYLIRPEIRSLVLFKKLNLVEFPYPLQGDIDIIFCRNVMIYFDVPTREKIINQFEKLLGSPGYLFLSHSEGLIGINHHLTRHDTSVFTNGAR